MSTRFLVSVLLLFSAFCSPVSGFKYNSIYLNSSDSIKYYNGMDFTLIGKFHSENNYARFPLKYKNSVRPEVWDLSRNSAGISIRFRSNATAITIKWTVMDEVSFPHMALTGIRGVDLYTNVNGIWQFIQTGRPKDKTSEYVMLEKGEPVYREYLLNLPLYDGVESLFIGVNANADMSKPIEQFLLGKKPVVYYGSSIAQGGCASRPGMAFTNILSRKLDRSFINFGFSGEGTFDTSVGEAMCEIDAALYVIDCSPNTNSEFIYERAVKLVQQLNKNRPEVPVLLVENFLFDNSCFMPDKMSDEVLKRTELKKAFESLKKSGITDLYYQSGDGLTGFDHEATVDGVHPTDLGMFRIAEFLLQQIERIL